ncbi:MAG: site-specific integrase [Acidobacteriia bacterium]|nr:site-specific integrase [Terriglobia bacterium]
MRGDGIRRRPDRGNAWYITWIDASGKRRKKRARRQSFQGARKELAQERAKAEEARDTGFVPMTFKEAARQYLQRQMSLVSPNEYERQDSILKKHLKPFFAGKLRNVSKRQIEEYISRRSRKRLPATVRKEVGVLKHLLNWAMENGMVAANAAARIAMPKAPAGRLRYLQPTELQAVLDHCPPWIQPIVLLAVSTGMRRGEILGLRWMDVDLLNRQINLPRTKNGKGRTVYLNEKAMDVFRSLELDKETLANEPVLGVDVTPEEVSMRFMRACRKAGVMDFHFHDLRHTYATWLRQSGVQLDEIARQLGHSDLRMTQRYAHLTESQAREAVCRLDSILRPLEGPGPKTGSGEGKLSRLN